MLKKTKLFQTQVEDVERIVGGIDIPNYSEPGAGKTNVTLGAIAALGYTTGVVIAPPIALPMWRDAIQEELGIEAEICKGAGKAVGNTPFVVMSYNAAVIQRPVLTAHRREALVLDESHNLKTPHAARTAAVFGPGCDGQGGIYETSKYCFTLTGTPILRHADDLWSQLRAIQPQALSDFSVLDYFDFVERFTHTKLVKYNARMQPRMATVGSKNMDQLNALLRHIGIVRRTTAEVAPYMPDLTFRHIAVRAMLQDEAYDILRKLGDMTPDNVIRALQAQDSSLTTLRRLLGLAKIKDVVDYVEESAEQGSVLVGYWHTDFGDLLTKSLREKGVTAARLGGDTPASERERIVEAFNGGELQVLVGQIAAMGVSLNLQSKSKHVIVAESHYSPGVLDQFVRRVWRMGQQQHVQCDYCYADTLIDNALRQVTKAKADSAAAALGD